jgi:hypothetical protein
MEGYAVAATWERFGVPVWIVKCVSDAADAEAALSWRDTLDVASQQLAGWAGSRGLLGCAPRSVRRRGSISGSSRARCDVRDVVPDAVLRARRQVRRQIPLPAGLALRPSRAVLALTGRVLGWPIPGSTQLIAPLSKEGPRG